jgi:hypothetical protein
MIIIDKKTFKVLNEKRYLIKVVVKPLNGDFSLEYEGKKTLFKGKVENFIKFLQKIQAKDNMSSPRSERNYTYKQMVDSILNGTDNVIWVWNKFLDNIGKVVYTERKK